MEQADNTVKEEIEDLIAGRGIEKPVRHVTLKIPNTEVRYIYKNAIQEWFGMKIKQKDLSVLYQTIEQCDTDKISRELWPAFKKQ